MPFDYFLISDIYIRIFPALINFGCRPLSMFDFFVLELSALIDFVADLLLVL